MEFVAAAPQRQRPKLRRALSALPLAVPTEETWQIVESWISRARDAGHSFGFKDLFIAALAAELNALVWSLDKDFTAMEKLGFVRRY
jgi:predicted nucleic acid-binding protein